MANLTISANATGWHVEGVTPGSPHRFTADLIACGCDGRKIKAAHPCSGGYHRVHVERFLTAVARTYRDRTPVPDVPDLPAV